MRRVILAIVTTVTALVLLLSFKTHSASSSASPSTSVSTPTTGTSSGESGSSSSSSSSSSSTTKRSSSKQSSASPTSTTVTGDAADTMYGPVQVRITVTNGKIVSATAIEYPTTDPRDQQINSFAIPELNQEATSAGNANIDMISGATYTSEGYIQSLQSALDKAKSS